MSKTCKMQVESFPFAILFDLKIFNDGLVKDASSLLQTFFRSPRIQSQQVVSCLKAFLEVSLEVDEDFKSHESQAWDL